MKKRRTITRIAVGVGAWVLSAGMAWGQNQQTFNFNSADALANWTVTGSAEIDQSRNRVGAGGSLKVAPGGKVIIPLRDTDGGGKVDVYVFDDMTVASNPQARVAGPRWGLIQADGHMLAAGVLYAPYLNGAETYAMALTDGKVPWGAWAQYSGVRRAQGWQKWTFDFNPQKGLSILLNGKPTRFEWTKTPQMRGFTGIVILGDDAKDGNQQTVWVDDLTVTLAGEVTAAAPAAQNAPAGPAQGSSFTPATDPAVEKPVALVPAVQGKHPRLLFTAEELETLKETAKGPGKPFFDQIVAYLPASMNVPTNTRYLTDATDAQRQGFWRLPTLAVHYAITGDRRSRERGIEFLKVLVEQEHWETGAEEDTGMGSANIMVGVAIAYDIFYNDLDPEFRETARTKLLTMARRQYHGGHLRKQPGVHYWQGDPQNNHRWHRNAGLTLAALAVADENRTDDDWIVNMVLEELKFVNQWLPEDGSSHESPSYLVFGAPYLTLAFDAADRCYGTDFLGHPFFRETPIFRVHTLLPGFKDAVHYGDSGGTGHINSYNFAGTGRHKLADAQAALLEFYKAATSDAFTYGWFSLIWFDPSVEGGSVENFVKRKLFEDIGLATLRDGWGENDVALMFKCGPYGGLSLNKYRNERNFQYINVAHDDPDANMFTIHARGGVIAENDRYAYTKLTSSHNTILVNGKGQKGEGGKWTQPMKADSPDRDMTKMARISAWRDTDAVTVVEGEAGRAYADLDQYRRTVVWVPGSYVMLLDRIDGKGSDSHDYTWLVQGKDAEAVDASAGRFRLKDEDKVSADVVVVSDKPFTSTIGTSTAEGRGQSLNLKQIQLGVSADQWHVVSAFDVWNKSPLTVTMTPAGDGQFTVTVKGASIDDTWTWTPAKDAEGRTGLVGKRAGGFEFSLTE